VSLSKRTKQQKAQKLTELPEKAQDYQTPAEERPKKKLPVGEEQRQMLVERLILEAMENGEFDNLPGKGKPLIFDDNPYLEPGQELAFGLLKRNGFAPEWIERDKTIRQELEAARKSLRLAWQQHQRNPANETKWQTDLAKFEAAILKLNQKIDDFNLIAPIISVQRPRLRPADELRRIQEEENPGFS
jgi:DnaJ family protein C protein 28